MDIDTMPAGKEMNALVAEKIMGWKNLEWKEGGSSPTEWGGTVSWPTGWYGNGPNGETFLTHSYSTDISAAWEILWKMWPAPESPYRWTVFRSHLEDLTAFLTQESRYAAEDICRAALKTVMVLPNRS